MEKSPLSFLIFDLGGFLLNRFLIDKYVYSSHFFFTGVWIIRRFVLIRTPYIRHDMFGVVPVP